jgi:formamidopyrimidine-DNA glycosylase
VPELPEVETIRRGLRDGGAGYPSLVGETVVSAQVLWARTLALPDAAQFCARLPGQVIGDFGRRGKLLIVCLTQDALLVHLRMSGDLRVESQQEALAPHHRLVLNFADGLRLAFNDPRKFGRVWLTPRPEELLARLGPEPFDPALTPQAFYQRLHAARRRLKTLLLDQSFLAGLGNIYTDEALHLARLHPLTPAHQVSEEQAGHLLEAIRQVLEQGIRAHGASIDWVYRGGDFQNYFRVYRRAGLPCPTCGAPVQRIVLDQRGTHFCPVCQPLT